MRRKRKRKRKRKLKKLNDEGGAAGEAAGDVSKSGAGDGGVLWTNQHYPVS